MCGIVGVYNLLNEPIPDIEGRIRVMNHLIRHRGPDGEGTWIHPERRIGLGHKRLSIIDLDTGAQPMTDPYGNTITYNGEIYNYKELRNELSDYSFRTSSDTEVILAAYNKWGLDCVSRFRGMFAFAIWDDRSHRLFCARDRFGIKPFYYSQVNHGFHFASEAKALLPFLPDIETDQDSLKDYLYFQLCLDGKTLFKNVKELMAGHRLVIEGGRVKTDRYWEVHYNLDFDRTTRYFEEKLRELIADSVNVHMRSDVPIGAYVSGGVDSGVISALVSKMKQDSGPLQAFTGKFPGGDLYDESKYAGAIADMHGMTLHQLEITSQDFTSSIGKIIYHLDYPVAGPGSFPQFHVSNLAARHRKVVLGGQGGDEIFGGYTRYLIAYFEQCIKGAIDNTLHNGNYVVTYESIIPNLQALRNYKPLLKEFWKEGLFEDLDKRYFRLINRAPDLQKEIRWNELGDYSPFETFEKIFNGANVGKESYFDKMTHFDFKTLLPALLQVEDRMSMAHGLESRVPFLDHPLVEFAATIPADIKFKNGDLKRILINAMRGSLPESVVNRKDKMGFPVPLNEWMAGDLKEFVLDIFGSKSAKTRAYVNSEEITKGIAKESKFGRKIWGLLSLELWHKEFHDKRPDFAKLGKSA
jgi:asparagine synthase (glutamine-hydrolysing)